jgi:hypothetical protein
LKDGVQVYYQLKNEEKAGLGMPMPAGVVRVYQNDSKGGVQFVGEDNIGHTPKDETLNLKIGNAFDVVAERKQIDFEKIATNVYEVEYEVTLRNHKSSGVSVGSERADRRHLEDPDLNASWNKDRRVGRAISGARRAGRDVGPAIPRASDLLKGLYSGGVVAAPIIRRSALRPLCLRQPLVGCDRRPERGGALSLQRRDDRDRTSVRAS